MDLVAARGQLDAEFRGNHAAAAIGGVAGDADLAQGRHRDSGRPDGSERPPRTMLPDNCRTGVGWAEKRAAVPRHRRRQHRRRSLHPAVAGVRPMTDWRRAFALTAPQAQSTGGRRFESRSRSRRLCSADWLLRSYWERVPIAYITPRWIVAGVPGRVCVRRHTAKCLWLTCLVPRWAAACSVLVCEPKAMVSTGQLASVMMR